MTLTEETALYVANQMLDAQVKQGNKRDPSVFVYDLTANQKQGGFTWVASPYINHAGTYLGWSDLVLGSYRQTEMLRRAFKKLVKESGQKTETHTIGNETIVL